MKKNINWGIIGCGLIAEKFASAMQVVETAKLCAVASNTPGKSEIFAKKFNVQKYYTSYTDLCNDAEIDIIYIANTHNFHKESAMLCLKKGKAVLCEKPFTLNVKEANEVINLAIEKNIFIMEAMWTRFHPVIAHLKKLLADKVIGEIQLLKVDFGIETRFGTEGRHLNPNLAGGALLDIGIYPITFADIVFNEQPSNMQSNSLLGKTGVDEISTYMFKYNSGAIAMLTAAVTQFIPHVAVIYGTKGKITVPDFFHSQELTIQYSNGNEEKLEFPFQVNGYEYEIMEATQCLLNGKTQSELMPVSRTLEIMGIMDNFRKSWKMFYPGENF